MAGKPFKGRKGRLEVVTLVKGEDGTNQADVIAEAQNTAEQLSNAEPTPAVPETVSQTPAPAPPQPEPVAPKRKPVPVKPKPEPSNAPEPVAARRRG